VIVSHQQRHGSAVGIGYEAAPVGGLGMDHVMNATQAVAEYFRPEIEPVQHPVVIPQLGEEIGEGHPESGRLFYRFTVQALQTPPELYHGSAHTVEIVAHAAGRFPAVRAGASEKVAPEGRGSVPVVREVHGIHIVSFCGVTENGGLVFPHRGLLEAGGVFRLGVGVFDGRQVDDLDSLEGLAHDGTALFAEMVAGEVKPEVHAAAVRFLDGLVELCVVLDVAGVEVRFRPQGIQGAEPVRHLDVAVYDEHVHPQLLLEGVDELGIVVYLVDGGVAADHGLSRNIGHERTRGCCRPRTGRETVARTQHSPGRRQGHTFTDKRSPAEISAHTFSFPVWSEAELTIQHKMDNNGGKGNRKMGVWEEVLEIGRI
jgi:hypothetical protein